MRQILAGMAVLLALMGCADAPAPAASQTAVSDDSVIGQLNGIRAQAGQAALSRNAQLNAAALVHARDMAANSFMGHTGTDGSDLRKRVERAGYGWCTLSENVSRGYSTNARAIEAWRVSPGHYANLIKNDAREFGMAEVNGFRVMVLAARRC